MMNLIEIKYKTDDHFKSIADYYVDKVLTEAIHNDDIGDTWHSFWYENMPYDVNVWTDDVTNITNCAIYSCNINEYDDIYTNEEDYYRVREEKILVH
jgi:hypothetical protein